MNHLQTGINHRNCLQTIILVSILSAISATICKATNRDSALFIKQNQFFIFPASLVPHKMNTAISISIIELPKDWVENSIEIPILNFKARYGFIPSIYIDFEASSIIISNELKTGPHWQHSFGQFALSAGADLEYMFGGLKAMEFNNKVSELALEPTISFGLDTKSLAFTTVLAATYVHDMTLRSGDGFVFHKRNFTSGGSVGIYMEQKAWRNRILIIGLISNFTSFYSLLWPVFNSSNRLFFIPQLQFGLVL